MKDLLFDVLAPQYEIPEGYDSWGIKSVLPDLRTRYGFRWPFPGHETARYELDADNVGSCPLHEGDGVCVATTWRAMSSSGFPARTLLLVAYRTAEAVGDQLDKLRVPQAFVVDLVDGESLIRIHGQVADLRDANLSGAYLRDANLSGANLRGADLSGADLRGAELRGADLSGADLRDANLSGAYLRGAYLGDAYLRDANLRDADLSGADLRGADLRGAYLGDAYLGDANLRGANLRGAHLSGADLRGAELRGAYLGDANLRDADLRNAQVMESAP